MNITGKCTCGNYMGGSGILCKSCKAKRVIVEVDKSVKLSSSSVEEFKKYIDFLKEVVSDSPHQGDDETMIWHYQMIGKLELLIEQCSFS
jgi:hypothetical protein